MSVEERRVNCTPDVWRDAGEQCGIQRLMNLTVAIISVTYFQMNQRSGNADAARAFWTPPSGQPDGDD